MLLNKKCHDSSGLHNVHTCTHNSTDKIEINLSML